MGEISSQLCSFENTVGEKCEPFHGSSLFTLFSLESWTTIRKLDRKLIIVNTEANHAEAELRSAVLILLPSGKARLVSNVT